MNDILASRRAGAWLVLQVEMTAGMIFASSITFGRALQPRDQLITGWRQTWSQRSDSSAPQVVEKGLSDCGLVC
ncbi:hypothetical protein [Chelativorans xinjiangense]|uniref:hypothetical protein n=1 Tax=Chelativorans xinjiangense TaxID=2681485 RepID=UPI0013577B83|nr:hypothetical protein [Chelativorans xinjiangense]